MYEFAKQNVSSLNVEYFTVGDWEAEGNCLRAALQTLPGTGQLHCFRHVSLFKVKVSQFSTSTQTQQETVTAEEHVIRFEEVKVTSQFSMMVTSLDLREREVAINFLNPHGPARSFTYPERPDNLVVGMGDILTTAHPTTITGRNLKKEHMAQVSNALEEWLQQ